MRSLLFLIGLLSIKTVAAPLDPLPLWPGGAPGALGTEEKDIPTVTPFLPSPETATGAALVICPGGGYGGLAPYEGAGYAEWFAEHGIAGFVLKYRLASGGYHHPAMIDDAARALRLVRSQAGDWKLDPQRIGIVGSSAGGHLASTLLTHFDAGNPAAADPIERVSSRPDLGILCYAVISMGPISHPGSRKNLLGENPDPALVDLLSNEKQVTPQTPTCFLWHTWEDAVVNVENALAFAGALKKSGVRFDLHIYEKGRHGLGLGGGKEREPLHPWTTDCLYWLKEQGFLNRK